MAISPAAQAIALDDDGTPTIHQCIRYVMKKVRSVAKSGKVPGGKFSKGFDFRGIDHVLNEVGPAFREIGIISTPHVITEDHDRVETVKDGDRRSTNYARIKVRYDFHGPAGDVLSAEVTGEAMDYGDKATSKAMSVAFRTALIQVLALPTQEARDPDEDLYEMAPAKTAREFAELVMAADITMEQLQDLYYQARDSKKVNHTVTGPDGKAYRLVDLIKGRKAALTAEMDAALEDTAPRTKTGKLNMNKMTDKERAERGVPTRAQSKVYKAEHKELVDDVLDVNRERKPAERDSGPAFDDPWETAVPGEAFATPPAQTWDGDDAWMNGAKP